MSRLYTATEVVDRALRRIGAFPTTETGAEPEDVAEALYWLDMLVAHAAGAGAVFWLRPTTLALTLTAGTGTYALADDVQAPALVADGVAFVAAVWLEHDGHRVPIRLVGRQEWESIEEPAREGRPELAWVDREQAPTLKTWPILPADETETFTLQIVAQTFAPDFTSEQGRVAMGMRASWNLWAVTALAAEIGSGPVRKIPDGEVQRLRERADDLWRQLEAFDIREHATPTRVAAHEF